MAASEQIQEQLPSSFTNYEEFLAAHEGKLPIGFRPDRALYIMEDSLFENSNGKPGIGVTTGWLNPEKVPAGTIQSEWYSSFYSMGGLEWMVRNCLAHPEIQHIILAGANLNSSMKAGSNMILDLYEHFIEFGEGVVEYAQAYTMLTPQVREFLPIFFERVLIHNLFSETMLRKSDLDRHWQGVNDYMSTLQVVEKPDYEPIYLSYEPNSKIILRWQDEGVPVVIDASDTSVFEAYKRMIMQIGRYGVEKVEAAVFPNQPPKKSVLELQGLKIKLDANQSFDNLTDEELSVYMDTEVKDEKTRQEAEEALAAYIYQFLNEDRDSVADYLYGNVIGPATPRVLQELKDRGTSMISLLNQEDILKSAPDCLTHISFQIIGGELSIEAYIRSNDMLNAWPKNAMGIIYLARSIVEQFNKGLDRKDRIRIGEVSTFSESAHFRNSTFGKVDSVNVEPTKPKELDTSSDDFAAIEMILQGVESGPSEGERVEFNISINKNHLTIAIGDLIINPSTPIPESLEGILQNFIPRIVHDLVYKHGILSSSREIVNFTTSLSQLMLSGKQTDTFILLVDDVDEVIKQENSEDVLNQVILQLLKRYPTLFNNLDRGQLIRASMIDEEDLAHNERMVAYTENMAVNEEMYVPFLDQFADKRRLALTKKILSNDYNPNDVVELLQENNMIEENADRLILPYTQVVLKDVETTSSIELDEDGVNDIVQVLTENLFGKSAMLVGNGRKDIEPLITPQDTYIKLGNEYIDISVHHVQFLVTPEGELSATAVVQNCDLISGDFGKAQEWIKLAQMKILEKLLELRERNPHNKLLDKLKPGNIILLLKNSYVTLFEVDKAVKAIKSVDTSVYREDPRGSVVTASNAEERKTKTELPKRFAVRSMNIKGGEDFGFEVETPEEGEDRMEFIAKETKRIVEDLVVRKGLYNIPGHIVHLTTSVYRELTNLLAA